MLSCVPPVRSPVTLRSVMRAARAAADPGVIPRAEQLVASRYDAQTVRLFGSGTQALQRALEVALAHVGGAATVAAPAFTCFDVASALIGARARVVLYDIDPRTLAPVPDSLEQALGEGARVLVLAPLYGVAPDYDVLGGLWRQRDVIVIEDIAQGHGTRWRGAGIGRAGHLATLSFGRGKGWTGGSGGALLVRDPALEDRTAAAPAAGAAKVLASAAAAALLSDPLLYGVPRSLPFLELGTTVYHPPLEVAAISRAAAALLIETAAASDDEVTHRRRAAAEYVERFRGEDAAHVLIEQAAGADCGWLRFPVLLAPGSAAAASARDAVRIGIAPSYPRPLSELQELSSSLAVVRAMPGAARLAASLVTLPTHSRASAATREGAFRWAMRHAARLPVSHAAA